MVLRVGFGGFALDQAVDDQQQKGASCCDKNSTQVKGLDRAQTNETSQKPAKDGAGDSDEDGDNESARVFPRHDEFGESPGNEA